MKMSMYVKHEILHVSLCFNYCFHYHVMSCFNVSYYEMWSYMYIIKKLKKGNTRFYVYTNFSIQVVIWKNFTYNP